MDSEISDDLQENFDIPLDVNSDEEEEQDYKFSKVNIPSLMMCTNNNYRRVIQLKHLISLLSTHQVNLLVIMKFNFEL